MHFEPGGEESVGRRAALAPPHTALARPAMGVPTLWKELEPAVRITSWAQLAAPAFEREGVRGFRLGVDVAQWLLCVVLLPSRGAQY